MSGQILDILSADYHSDTVADTPTLSASIAKTIVTYSPKHAWTAHPKLNPNYSRDEELKFDIGRAAHALFLEGDANVEVFTYDNWTTKAAKESRAEARAHGKTPMLGKDWDRVQELVFALEAGLNALTIDPPLFAEGKPEQTLVWEDSGVTCRARLDWLRDDYTTIDDLKTSHNANPANWTRRTLFDIGADLQTAFYRRGVKAITGVDPLFRFVVVETKPPYELSVVSLDPATLALAEAKVDKALELWKTCLATDSWPGYPREVCYAGLPSWQESAWLEREARDEERAA